MIVGNPCPHAPRTSRLGIDRLTHRGEQASDLGGDPLRPGLVLGDDLDEPAADDDAIEAARKQIAEAMGRLDQAGELKMVG